MSRGRLHFKLDEFRCPCCNKVVISPKVVMVLEVIRRIYGKPIIVTSGFRCKKHNSDIGGSKYSSHLKGLAVDFIPNDMKDVSTLWSIVFNYWRIRSNVFRVGFYGDGHIHLDIDMKKPKGLWFDSKRTYVGRVFIHYGSVLVDDIERQVKEDLMRSIFVGNDKDLTV